MKLGTKQEGFTTKCANCGRVISKSGVIEDNYCSNCGAPLTALAIAEYSEILSNANKKMVAAFVEIAKKNNTDSFTDILEVYTKS